MLLNTERKYQNAMKRMIKRIQKTGDIPDPRNLSDQDAEILMDCVKQGFLIGEAQGWDERRHAFIDHRVLTGKAMPEVHSATIPLKGVIFLKPTIDWKFVVPTAISIAALIITFFK